MKTKLLMLMLLIVGFTVQSQDTIYIDPSDAGSLRLGTLEEPYNDWVISGIPASNTTYLTKRGTSLTLTVSRIYRTNVKNVTFGAYGTGERPIIYHKVGSASAMIQMTGDSLMVRDLSLRGNPADVTGRPLAGVFFSARTSANSNNVSVINCEISYAYNGVRAMPYKWEDLWYVVDDMLVDSCIVHHIAEDGMFISNVHNFTATNNHLYDINTYYWSKGANQNDAPGDGIQIGGEMVNWNVSNNIFDRRSTGAKFCFIHGGIITLPGTRGKFNNNIIYPPKDSLGTVNASSTGVGIYGGGGGDFYTLEHVEFNYNRFIGRGYGSTTDTVSPGSAGYVSADTVLVYYNTLDSVQYLRVAAKKHIEVMNNTVVTDETISTSAAGLHVMNSNDDNVSGKVHNNVVAVGSGYSLRFNDPLSVQFDTSNNIAVSTSSVDWNDILGFNDWSTGDFRPLSTSPVVDAGLDYTGYTTDLAGNPIDGIRDIGAYEYQTGTPPPPDPPLPPAYVNVSEITQTSAKFTWPPSSGATSYYIGVYESTLIEKDTLFSGNIGNVLTYTYSDFNGMSDMSYGVVVKASNANGSSAFVMNLFNTLPWLPDADFSWDTEPPNYPFYVGDTINFVLADNSLGDIPVSSALWNTYGAKMISENPSYSGFFSVKGYDVSYPATGTFSIGVTLSNAGGDTTITYLDAITILPTITPPVAEFYATTTTAKTGQTVQFYNLSTGSDPLTYAWTFESGTPAISDKASPTVTWAAAGTYDVSLTVTNAAGEDIETKVDYITVTADVAPTPGTQKQVIWK